MTKLEYQLLQLGYRLLAKKVWIKNEGNSKLSIELNDNLDKVEKWWVRPCQEILNEEEIKNIELAYKKLKNDINILNNIGD